MKCITCGHEFFYGNKNSKYCLQHKFDKEKYIHQLSYYKKAENESRAKKMYVIFLELINCVTADDDPIEFGRALNKKFIELTGEYPGFYK